MLLAQVPIDDRFPPLTGFGTGRNALHFGSALTECFRNRFDKKIVLAPEMFVKPAMRESGSAHDAGDA